MSLQIRSTIDQHFEGALSQASQRMTAMHESHYSLNDIVSLDNQLQKHCDALAMSGDKDRSIAEYGETDSATAFIHTVFSMALDEGNYGRLTRGIMCCPDRSRYLSFALGWMEWPVVSRFVNWLLQSSDPALNSLGLNVSWLHGMRPDLDLSRILDSSGSSLPVAGRSKW